MSVPKYDGTIHPDEWLKKLDAYFMLHNPILFPVNHVATLVDPSINVENIDSTDQLLTALKNSTLFKIFLKSNKQKLSDLRYKFNTCGEDNESAIEFLAKFISLCHNSEIIDINEQKEYLIHTLDIRYQNEFSKKIKDINTYNELLESFQDFIIDQKCRIRNYYIIIIKHVASGMYLSSSDTLDNFSHGLVTLSDNQSSPYCQWQITDQSRIRDDRDDDIHYGNKFTLINKMTNKYLYSYDTQSPATNHKKVYCNNGYGVEWVVRFDNSESYNGTWKLKDKFSLFHNQNYILRSHDFYFNIGDKTFREVVCHNERFSGNDEWCIEICLKEELKEPTPECQCCQCG